MRILTAREMRSADESAIAEIGIGSRSLMESAGRECAALILRDLEDLAMKGVVVVAGAGNNGGDGFVIARTLKAAGCPAAVVFGAPAEKLKVDSRANLESWKRFGGAVHEYTSQSADLVVELLSEAGLIVDAVFGTGFRGEPRGAAKELIDLINGARRGGVPVIAVDIPSGVDASTSQKANSSVEADYTVALQSLKVGHVLFPGTQSCGKVYVADIGIPLEIPALDNVQRTLLTSSVVSKLLRYNFKPNPQSHKGTHGHVMVVGGSAGHFGAPKMSARAALSAGAGLATMLLPERAAQEIQSQLVETMCLSAPEASDGSFAPCDAEVIEEAVSNKDAVVLGPGLGQSKGAHSIVSHVLRLSDTHHYPVIIDADAINLISKDSKLRSLVPPHAVLTPHPGEMGRLTKRSASEVQECRLELAAETSAELGCWLVLKGARTIIAGPTGEVFVNPTACEALATGGSGDVLSGILGAFAARGIALGEAACAAVFIHGLAGESAMSEEGGSIGVVASSLIERAPKVINSLLAVSPPQRIFPGCARAVLQAPA